MRILILSSIEFIPQTIQYGLENMFYEEPGIAQLWPFATLLDEDSDVFRRFRSRNAKKYS